MFAGAPDRALKVTLCVTLVGLFHVTVAPLEIVIEAGLNVLSLPMHTVSMLGVHAAPDGLPDDGAVLLSPPLPPQYVAVVASRATASRR